ncbi:MAG: tetratricopeptide repeat protein, partial [Theionarchaea archaeon]|nr:tetratricopeptide repeat protein [Theionarchaea archaeon]
EEALEAFEKAIELDDKNISAWINKGYALRNLRRYEEALEAFEKAIELDDKNVDAWITRGYALGILERYEEALEAFEKAIELDDKNVDAWTNKGYALFELERNEEALEAFEKAIELDDKNISAWINKGYALRNLRIELDDKNVDAWVGKGYALSDLERNDEALEAFEKAIELDEKNINAWINRGYALHILERNDEALEAFEKATELDEKNVDAWVGKGATLCNLERYEEALEAFEKAIELSSDYDLPYIYRGEILHLLGDTQNATGEIEKALNTNNKSTWALILRGKICIEQEEYDEAIKYFEEATRSKLGDPVPSLWIIYTKYLKIESSHSLKDKEYQRGIGTIIRRLETMSDLYKNTGKRELKAYILYYLGYFYYRNKDISAAKEKLEECRNLGSIEKEKSLSGKTLVESKACELLKSIWIYEMKATWWNWWLFSPFYCWTKRILFSLILVSISYFLFFDPIFFHKLSGVTTSVYVMAVLFLIFILLSPNLRSIKTEGFEVELQSPLTLEPTLSPLGMEKELRILETKQLVRFTDIPTKP